MISKHEAISVVYGVLILFVIICLGAAALGFEDLTRRVESLEAQINALRAEGEAIKIQQDHQTDALIQWHQWYEAKRLGFNAADYFADRALRAGE